MADRHVDGAGSNTSPYDTWAKAATAVATAVTGAAAGDRLLFGSAYSETVAGISIAVANTPSSPYMLLSGTKGASSGLTALGAGAILQSSSTTYSITGCLYAYGMSFKTSSGSSHAMNFGTTSGNICEWDTCTFDMSGGAGGSNTFTIGSATAAAGTINVLRDCSFKMGASTQRIDVSYDVRFKGGSWLSGGTAPAGVFVMSSGNRHTNLQVEGFDFSNLATTTNLVATTAQMAQATFRDCKLPASWTGSLIASGQIKAGSRIAMWNCGNGATVYRVWVEDYHYTLRDDTAVYKSGGYTDDATPVSWKMTTTANCAYPSSVAVSPDMLINNTTTGSSKTVTVDIIHDSATALTDAEVWLEVEALNTSGQSLGVVTRDIAASVLATPANQTSSSATWTNSMTNPNKQALAVSFTPQQKGYFLARVCCAKASKVLYIDPKPVVS